MPTTARTRLLAAALALAAAALIVAVLVGDGRRGPVPGRSVAPTGATVPTTPVLPTTPELPTTPTSTTPVQAAFPTQDCRPATLAGDGTLGLGLPRPARLDASPVERAAFDAAVQCLTTIAGRPPVLRTQFPIDVTRRVLPGDDELAEVRAFGAMLSASPAPAIVSIRAHDFTRCGRGGAPAARVRTTLAPGEALRSCEYPSLELYAQLFGEVRDAILAAAPAADLRFTAWNEPDHPTFTLLDAFGQVGAARRAGQYWTRAAAIAGADRVLAGEFADRDLPTLLQLRDGFLQGTGGVAPPAWAIHPYRDLTAPSREHVIDGFTQAVAPAAVWLTEVTARLSGRNGITGKPGAQLARGALLRARLQRTPTRVVLYLLIPPPAPQNANQDGWDSALADRSGRARPFICGLAGLPATRCPGNAEQFGG